MEELRSSGGFCLSDAEEGDNELRHGRVDNKAPQTGWAVSLESRLRGRSPEGEGQSKGKGGKCSVNTDPRGDTQKGGDRSAGKVYGRVPGQSEIISVAEPEASAGKRQHAQRRS